MRKDRKDRKGRKGRKGGRKKAGKEERKEGREKDGKIIFSHLSYFQGSRAILRYFNGNAVKAIMHLFPEIGLEEYKFRVVPCAFLSFVSFLLFFLVSFLLLFLVSFLFLLFFDNTFVSRNWSRRA
jgi:hypothetical protein